jgi:hypothetical protein
MTTTHKVELFERYSKTREIESVSVESVSHLSETESDQKAHDERLYRLVIVRIPFFLPLLASVHDQLTVLCLRSNWYCSEMSNQALQAMLSRNAF